jgi:hypothetical protein
MAISSALNPDAIIGRQNKNAAAVQSFITGGAPIGSSIANSVSANKIVGFQRAAVQPVAPNTSSMISAISNNILNSFSNLTEAKIQQLRTETINNIQNVVQTIQLQTQSSLQKTIGDLSKNYQEKIQNTDAAKPTSILEKFLSTYQKALGFIQFFANRKNIESLEKNLDILKKSFTDSFEVAKLIRQVIVKIVNQLSSLPTAQASGGGGIDINVDLPMSNVKKSSPTGMKNMFSGKGKMIALGAGALGLGAAGAGVVNALSDSDELKTKVSSSTISEDSITLFSSIVERFSNIIDSLFKNISKTKQTTFGTGSSGGGTKSTSGPRSGANPGINPPDTGAISGNQTQIESQMFDYLKTNYGENVAYGMLSNAMRESGYRTNAPEGGYFGMFQLDKNRETRFKEWAKSKNLDPMSHQAQLQYGVIEAQQLGTLERMKAAKTPEDAASLFYNEFERAAYSKPIVGSAYTPNNPHEIKNRKFLQQIRERQSKRTPGTIPGAPAAPVLPSPEQITAAPTATQTKQQIAQMVAQPPPSQQQSSQMNMLPIALPQTTQQQQEAPVIPSTSGGVASGPAIPMLPTSDPNNFLVLYSKMVYNIVDG